MAKPLSVFVNIGAKVGSSVGASASAVERRFGAMGRNLKVQAAEAKLAMKAVEDGAGKRRGDLFDAAAMGAGLMMFAKPAMEFEDKLIRVGNIAQQYDSDLAKIGAKTIATGKSFGVGGRAALDGLNNFLAAGQGIADAQGALKPSLMLARTANIDAADASAVGVAAMQNLGVAVTDLELAYDRMTMAGKKGMVEVSDMARFFPRVTASAQKLGFAGLDGVGRIGAMLQVTRMGAQNAEQAANDLYNLMEKMTADETAKNFFKMGVDLPAMFKEAKATGQDYFSMVVKEAGRLTNNGEDAFAVNALFGDLQARNALTMLTTHAVKVEEITEATRKAAGVMKKDWERVSKSAAAKTEVFKAQVEGLGLSLGRTLLPILGGVAAGLGFFLGKIGNFADAYPAVTTGVVTIVGALVAYRVWTIAAAWASGFLNVQFLAMKGSLLSMAGGLLSGVTRGLVGMRNAALTAGFALQMGGIRGAGALLLTMLNPLRLVTGALRMLKLAVIGTGIGAILVGIALAGMWIANNWKGIGAFFTAFGAEFMKAIAPVRPVLEPVIGLFKGLFGAVEKITGPLSLESWTKWGKAAGTAVGNVVKSIVDFIAKIGEGITKLREFFGAAKGGGAAPGAAVAGARARGGPVWGGAPFLVGERGPELFVPPGRGNIMTAGATASALAASASAPGGAAPSARVDLGGVIVNIYDATNPAAVAREVESALRRMASEQSGLYSD